MLELSNLFNSCRVVKRNMSLLILHSHTFMLKSQCEFWESAVEETIGHCRI